MHDRLHWTKSPALVGVAFGFGAFTVIATGMNTMMPGWLAWYRLSSEGQTTLARVTSLQPEQHQRCFFEFTVGAKVFKGATDGCAAAVGSLLPVTYSPRDPAFVTTRSPRGELLLQVIGAVVMAIAAGIGGGLRWRWRRSRGPGEAAQQEHQPDEARKEDGS